MYVEVAVNLPPVRGTFHYHLPDELDGRVQPGHLVTVPFGAQRVQGVVLSLPEHPEVPETRPVESLVDPAPVLMPAQLSLARWLHQQTMAPLIECLALMIPPGLSRRADSLFTLQDTAFQPRNEAQRRLISLLERRGPLRGRQIEHALSRIRWRESAQGLIRLGIVGRTSVLDPPGVQGRRIRSARLAVPPDAAQQALQSLGRAGSQALDRRRAVLRQLIAEREPVDVTWLYAEAGGQPSDLSYLEERGLIALGETEVWRDPLAEVEFVACEPPRLTTGQSTVWESVRSALRDPLAHAARPILLHGVTASGKTEIYLRAVAEVIELGRSAIVLVPEIALTPQTVRRFLARFPGQVGLVHSQLSAGERYDTWRRSRAGLLRVIVGARSALFTPVPDIGLIVIDECHDESYKEQGQAPRYHARETAAAYARILDAVLLLGSATPEVVTFYHAQKGQIELLSLPQRILAHREYVGGQSRRLGIRSRYRQAEGDSNETDLPPVRVVDMRQELRAGNRSIFSRALQQALQQTLDARQQAILFLNRRGAASYIFCRDCGSPLRCPRCELPLTYHSSQENLQCHHCGYSRRAPSRCPHCGGTRIRHFGAGTQRVEAEVMRLFPRAGTIRWDWDTTRTRGSHEVILAHFAAHRADVLVGTQMIAKGLDLPLVTLVGVVSADTGLNLPDFRAAERTFQVLTQVAGRAGRGLLGGQVVLQTFQPEHYAIQAASGHDYLQFYSQELQLRRALQYPPFSRLLKLVYRHTSARAAQTEAERLATHLKHRIAASERQARLIGPAPCFFRRVRGDYRWQLVLSADDPLPWVPAELPEGWSLDVDPISLL